MKKVVLVIAFLFLFSAVGAASPLLDYSQGKVAIDLNLRPSGKLAYSEATLNGKSSNLDLGLTFGLGNKFAFQWLNQASKTKTYSFTITDGSDTITGSGHSKLTANQFNLLYLLDKNIAGFVGYTQAKNNVYGSGTYDGVPFTDNIPGKTVKGWQAGFTGAFPLGEKLTGYGTVGLGNKIESFEFGVAYELSKNAELNLFYKTVNYKDLQFQDDDDKYNLRVKGPGVGLTLKF